MAELRRQPEIERMLREAGWKCECYLSEVQGDLFAAQVYVYPGHGLREDGEGSMSLVATHRDPAKAEELVLGRVRGWLAASPTGRLVMRLTEEMRTLEQEVLERNLRLNGLREEVADLRVKDFMDRLGEYMRPFKWHAGNVCIAQERPSLRLDAEASDEAVDALHDALGLGYHGQAALAPGVRLVVSDGDVGLIFDSVDGMLAFVQEHGVNVDWRPFAEGLQAVDEHLERANRLREALAGVVDATHFSTEQLAGGE